MNNPVFSIITCTYNSEKFVKKNFESVKLQTFKDYEQIVIDGQSKDETIKIAKLFQKDDLRIKIFFYPSKGIGDAFNKGIKHSKGKYLFFLNSDDQLYDENVLKNISEFLTKNPQLDWIYGKIYVVEENGKRVGIFPNRKIFQTSNKYLLKFFNTIPHQAAFLKRNIFERFGCFDTRLKTNMDTELWLRIARKTNWRFYSRIVSKYCIRKESASSGLANKNESLKSLEIVQSKYLNRFEMIPAKIVNRLVTKINRTYR